MPIKRYGVLERSRERRKADDALKEIGGEPLEGSGFEDEPTASCSDDAAAELKSRPA
jgi:hypothetical protein